MNGFSSNLIYNDTRFPKKIFECIKMRHSCHVYATWHFRGAKKRKQGKAAHASTPRKTQRNIGDDGGLPRSSPKCQDILRYRLLGGIGRRGRRGKDEGRCTYRSMSRSGAYTYAETQRNVGDVVAGHASSPLYPDALRYRLVGVLRMWGMGLSKGGYKQRKYIEDTKRKADRVMEERGQR